MTDTWCIKSAIISGRFQFRCEFCNKGIPSGRWHKECLDQAVQEWRASE
jgi:hypothetical protein